MTPGICDLPSMVRAELIRKVTEFNDFSADTDQHAEHDFGSIDLCSRRFFWKIDYYNLACDGGSEDPANPATTTRVLTLMLASEY